MPERNSFADDINPHHDLCTEVAQMTHGHIGFGCYSALHHNEDGDLAEAGDKNTELGDDEYVFDPRDVDEGRRFGDEGAGGNLPKSKVIFYGDHPIFDLLLNRTPAKNKCCVRSEVLTTRCHRGIKRLQAEDRKYQQFYGSLRVR